MDEQYEKWDKIIAEWEERNLAPRFIAYMSTLYSIRGKVSSPYNVRIANYIRNKGYKVILGPSDGMMQIITIEKK